LPGLDCHRWYHRAQGGAAAEHDVGRFLAAAERMGLPSFAASDLETVRASSASTQRSVIAFSAFVFLDYLLTRHQ
jgi:hypothetical protein